MISEYVLVEDLIWTVCDKQSQDGTLNGGVSSLPTDAIEVAFFHRGNMIVKMQMPMVK